MEYLSAEDLNEIEKRIPYPFPESFRNWLIGRYVKGARNYLTYGVDDEEEGYYEVKHALLNFESLDENWGFKEYNSIVAENLRHNDNDYGRRIPKGIIISRTKWGDPIACLYFFINENYEVGNNLYLSIEQSEPELKLNTIHDAELSYRFAVNPSIIELLEEKIGAKLPDKFKKMLYAGESIHFDLIRYDFLPYIQKLKTEADVDQYIRQCLYVKNQLNLTDFPLLIIPNGIGDELLLIIRNGEVVRQWYELDHEQAKIVRTNQDWMY